MFPVVTLLLSKTTCDQDRLLFVFSSPLPTHYFGDGSMTTHTNILLIKTAIPHTWRRNTDDRFVTVSSHTPLYEGHGSRRSIGRKTQHESRYGQRRARSTSLEQHHLLGWFLDSAFQCRQCTVMFRDKDRFTIRRDSGAVRPGPAHCLEDLADRRMGRAVH
jgi:hypothetical protein